MRTIYFTLACILFISLPFAAFSQTGKIIGKVINASSGQPLSNATVTLLEKKQSQAADQNGGFSFGRLAAGTYSVQCTYAGLEPKTVTDIIVADKEVTTINISLEEKKNTDGVVVTGVRVRAAGETVASLLIAQKNNASMMDGITAQQIKLAPNKGASDVIRRVSGASIQDDRFAVIRGLNDRYNASFINGAPLPSTESDRKAFAFDIFPSDILDNLIIFKTATPDRTAEFAGGIIDITTKATLPKSFTSVSFGGSYNSLATGDLRYFSENRGSKDWLGIDDGTRGIPDGMPSSAQIKNVLSFADRAELAKKFGNYRWGVRRAIAPLNSGMQLSKGFNIEKDQREFISVLLAGNYSRTYSFTDGQRNSVEKDLTNLDSEPVQRARYIDSVYNDEVVVAAIANLTVKVNNKNSLTWKNNYSINTDNKLIRRTGNPDLSSDSLFYISEIVRWYTSNRIFTSQLAGEHSIGARKTKLNWLASFANVNRDIPELSRTAYSATFPDLGNRSANFVTPPNQTSGSGSMFFSNSEESIKNIKADFTQPYTFMKNATNQLKIGAGYQGRTREFTSRVLGFSPYNGGGVVFDNSLATLPEGQLYRREHLGLMKNGLGGFILNDGTLANADYTASSSTLHAYVMTDQKFYKKLRAIYGMRMERFNQKLNSIRNQRDTIALNTVITDFLPSANLIYALNAKMNLRLSYSATINRPEFRELAPFLFYDYVTNITYEGQETLKRAKINNLDFRYEYFPGNAQLFSVSAFYKDFKNPIEIISVPNTTNQVIYANATSARVYGAEAEFRVRLSYLFGKKSERSILNKFILAGNAAYTKSSIKIDSLLGISASQLITDRALQGQSPFIVNGSLGFNDEKSGLSTTVSFNRVDDRIFIAGTYNTPSIYEKARNVLDFQLAKSFANRALEIKLTVKDILMNDIKFYFDLDRSNKFSPADRYFSTNRAPRTVSLYATYRF